MTHAERIDYRNVSFLAAIIGKRLAALAGGPGGAIESLAIASSQTDGETALSLEPGTILVWPEGVPNLRADLSRFLGDDRDRSAPARRDRAQAELISEARGDLDLVDTYLSMGRKKPLVTRLVDSYIASTPFRTFVSSGDPEELDNALGGHVGPIWIKGPFELAAKPSPAPSMAYPR